MKILLIGSGGREHAIAWKLSQDKRVDKIYVAPGNAGTALEVKCENISLKTNKELLSFAKANGIDLTIVGPEQPLADGIVDLFVKNNLKIFGPNKLSAKLETSKSFAKEFMIRNKIATAKYHKFSNYKKAKIHIENSSFPLVLKADGLAAGKGVIICNDITEANEGLKRLMVDNIFKGASDTIVIEEYLEGVEASIICVCDNKIIKPLISSKDHKKLFEKEQGPNTGGMGAICPNPYFNKSVEQDFIKNILSPTVNGLKKEKLSYQGFLFFGVMITKQGCKLLEYNVRMGDPETQSILPLMKSNFLEIIESCLNNKLSMQKIEWFKKYAINVVLASLGYPDAYETGFEIQVPKNIGSNVFYAGAVKKQNSIVTSGGRVLSVVATDKNKTSAFKQVYSDVKKIKFQNKIFRTDIGK